MLMYKKFFEKEKTILFLYLFSRIDHEDYG